MPLFGAAIHRHVPALGILQVHAKGLPRQQREHVIAQPPMPGHGLACGRPVETVALHVVGLTRQSAGASNAGKSAGCICPSAAMTAVKSAPSDNACLQPVVIAEPTPRLAGCSINSMGRSTARAILHRRVYARIVDDDDVVDKARNVLERAAYQLRLVVGRHYDRDSSTSQA